MRHSLTVFPGTGSTGHQHIHSSLMNGGVDGPAFLPVAFVLTLRNSVDLQVIKVVSRPRISEKPW